MSPRRRKNGQEKNVKILYPPRTDRNAYRNMRTTHTRYIHSILIYILCCYYILRPRTLHYLQSCLRLSSNKNKGACPGRVAAAAAGPRKKDRATPVHTKRASVFTRVTCVRVCVCSSARARARPSPFILVSALTGGHFPIWSNNTPAH